MNLFKKLTRCPHSQLYLFICGTVAFFFTCMIVTAYIFSEIYLGKEKERAGDYSRYVKEFFDFEYSNMSQQMWGHSYDGIHNRVKGIARQLGQKKYGLVLANADGNCVFSYDSSEDPHTSLHESASVDVPSGTLATRPCLLPRELKEHIPLFQPLGSKSVIEFDAHSERYIYMIPLYVGVILQGYLYASLTDPNQYYRGNSSTLISRFFLAPITSVVIATVIWFLLSYQVLLKPYMANQVAKEKKEALGELAGAVAHNIRAPLVALQSFVKSINGIDPNQRRLLNLVSSRIGNIANELLTKFTHSEPVDGRESFSFLSMAIDAIISERVAVLGEYSKIEFKLNLSHEAASVGIPLASHEISSILSNLLQNSIQAIGENQPGLISITGTLKYGKVLLCVKDNGRGIPKDILGKLRTVGGTYGKVDGIGLGLRHAKMTLSQVNGSLSIESTEDNGTQVILKIPLAELPKWYATRINASQAKTIVVLEDDDSVNLLWRERLGGENVVYLTDPSEFDITQYPVESSFFILDHEINGSQLTGLDLIQKFKLGDRAVLATSYFNDPKIQKSIEESGASMIPKFMIPDVEILRPIVSDGAVSKKYDLVLIDDDHLVHELWHFDALAAGKSMKAVDSLESLNLSELDFGTPIYIDKNLAKGASGFDVAKALHVHGFSNLTIATGDRVSSADVPDCVKSVQNKVFPFKQGNLSLLR